MPLIHFFHFTIDLSSPRDNLPCATLIIAAVDSAKFHVQSLLKRFPTAKILDEKFASAYMKFLSDDGHLLYTNEITDIEIETFLISNDLFYVSIHLAETNDGETLVDDSILAEDSFEDMPGRVLNFYIKIV